MDKGRYSIIFSSLTGNTKKLADTIRAVLPAEDCDYFGAPESGRTALRNALYRVLDG